MRRLRLLLCIGNTLRSDDGAAHALGLRMEARSISDLHVLFEQQLLPEHAADAAEADIVVIVDASLTARTVTLEDVDGGSAAVAGEFVSTSTPPTVQQTARALRDMHAMLPRDLADMTALLGGRQPRILLCHIPAERFEHGEELSPATRMHVAYAEEVLVRFFAAPPPVHRGSAA